MRSYTFVPGDLLIMVDASTGEVHETWFITVSELLCEPEHPTQICTAIRGRLTERSKAMSFSNRLASEWDDEYVVISLDDHAVA